MKNLPCVGCKDQASCPLCEGTAVEREHADLYRHIRKHGLPDEEEFYKRIAAAHLRERSDYYKLLKRYVEP
jgi:hypothetical protein